MIIKKQNILKISNFYTMQIEIFDENVYKSLILFIFELEQQTKPILSKTADFE